MVHAEPGEPQTLLFPVMSLGADPKTDAVLEYLDDRCLWLTAPIDASRPEMTNDLDYHITSDGTSPIGQALEVIGALEGAKKLPEGSLVDARNALLSCRFEASRWYSFVGIHLIARQDTEE